MLDGEILVMTGAGYANETEFDEMPPTVTDTVTEAPSPAGITQTTCVKLIGVDGVSDDDPQFTITFAVEVKKLVPVMVTAVPPAVVGFTAHAIDEIWKAVWNQRKKAIQTTSRGSTKRSSTKRTVGVLYENGLLALD